MYMVRAINTKSYLCWTHSPIGEERLALLERGSMFRTCDAANRAIYAARQERVLMHVGFEIEEV